MSYRKLIMRASLFSSLFFGVAGFAAPAWSDVTVDNTLYAELLDTYVKNGVVDYQGFKNIEAEYLDYDWSLNEK